MSPVTAMYAAAGAFFAFLLARAAYDLIAEDRAERRRLDAQRTVIVPVSELERERGFAERMTAGELTRGEERLLRDVMDPERVEEEMLVEELREEIEVKGVEGLTARRWKRRQG